MSETSFLKKIVPSRRRIIQLYSAVLYNAHLKGFITGNIFTGKSKGACLPGMNCYSCPGAIGACPLGSIQSALAESKTKTPFYVLGIILLYCIMFGRTICGYLCPAGFLQELLYKIKTPKIKKSKVTRVLSYFKYVLLVVFVFILPLIYALQSYDIAVPAFCKYICPVGTFEGAVLLLSNPNNGSYFGMLGFIFTWKFAILVAIVVLSIFMFRPFCRFLCPLGALYGIFNKISVIGIKVNKDKCTSCNRCVDYCKMDVKEVGDHECINCGECKKVCPVNCIDWKLISKKIKEENASESVEVKESAVDTIESEPKKTKKLDSRTVLGLISTTLAVILLVFTLISVNFEKKTRFVVGDEISKVEVKYIGENASFSLDADVSISFVYFFDQEPNFDFLNKVQNDNYQVLAVTTFDNKDNVVKHLGKFNNVVFAYDGVNQTALHMFTDNNTYPYYVSIDSSKKIVVSSEELTDFDFNAIINPTANGIIFSNTVGEYCIFRNLQNAFTKENENIVYSRGKVAVINFWYTTCTPCKKELPYFNELANTYSEDVDVYVVHDAYNVTLEKIVKEVEKNKWTDWNVKWVADNYLIEGDSSTTYYAQLGGKQTFPMTFIIDQEGKISFIKVGELDKDTLFEEVEKLLNK